MIEITKMLALSTAHLTEQTCNSYLPGWEGPAYKKGEYGWFVPIFDDCVESVEPAASDLKECMLKAIAEGCDWLMFDRDVDTIDDLKVYDW